LKTNVALTAHREGYIRQLIESGRYNNANEVVRTALRKLQETEGEIFPAGISQKSKLAKRILIPKPDAVRSPGTSTPMTLAMPDLIRR
jgi:putative addiction module CopG family antidote